MPIQIRDRDPRSVMAAAAEIPRSARRVLEALAASTTELQKVAAGSANPRTAVAAVAALRQGQAAVRRAEAELLAWCLVGGVTRTGIQNTIGCRPDTLTRLLSPVAAIAAARGSDLQQRSDGSWTVQR